MSSHKIFGISEDSFERHPIIGSQSRRINAYVTFDDVFRSNDWRQMSKEMRSLTFSSAYLLVRGVRGLTYLSMRGLVWAFMVFPVVMLGGLKIASFGFKCGKWLTAHAVRGLTGTARYMYRLGVLSTKTGSIILDTVREASMEALYSAEVPEEQLSMWHREVARSFSMDS